MLEHEAGSGAGNANSEGGFGGSSLSDGVGGGQGLGDHLVGESKDPGPLFITLKAGSAACRVSLVHGGL